MSFGQKDKMNLKIKKIKQTTDASIQRSLKAL